MDPAERLREILRRTVEGLVASRARDEALAVQKPGRGIAVFRTADSMTPVGRAWRLGVLLLDHDGQLGSVGKITRAVEPGRPQSLSASVEQRRSDRMAASRGAFAPGEVVNYGWNPIAQDADSLLAGSGPLSVDGDEILVQWGPAPGERRPIEAYLIDRAGLLHLD